MGEPITREVKDDHCAGDNDGYSKDEECYICGNKAVDERRVCIDAEPEHDEDGKMTMVGVYGDVGLCQEHIEEHDEQVGVFDPYKHKEA